MRQLKIIALVVVLVISLMGALAKPASAPLSRSYRYGRTTRTVQRTHPPRGAHQYHPTPYPRGTYRYRYVRPRHYTRVRQCAYYGDRRTRMFYTLNCGAPPYGSNWVCFNSWNDAARAGYHPVRMCRA